ncbi:DeoR/GlpR family DNA-binding transcription regulator [Actinopolymorpha alba]|uniref:DeoR/GlpR family DNA-binding transcription regulator n=1 Tax=Actinopolymorpha alba TaxID=533267 RepID=UPI000368653D|nr:DeoR/GlpR family DNA-binding transcription regulator [Actinopolymorpha alba]
MTIGTPGAEAGRRREAILRQLARTARLDVSELKEEFGVSEMTIRRDLAKLAQEGVLRRVHGGAVRVERSAFESRTVRFADEKHRIAKQAAALVGEGQSVGIDTGTTAQEVARALAERSGLTIVTNSINAAVEFRGSPNRVMLIGGVLVHELCTVGSFATDALKRLHVNTFVVGCGGLTPERGLSYFDIEETEVRRAMIDIADTVVAVMDHSKFGRTETVALASIAEVDVLVTDAEPPRAIVDVCRKYGVEIIIA